MRLGIISDVHSNFEALQASYNELCKRGCDKIISLGDVVGYGPSPGECIDFFVEKEITSIKGNHDYYINCDCNCPDKLGITPNAFEAVKWTRDELCQHHLEWLENLPFTITENDTMFIHAAVDTAEGEYWPYIFDIHSAMFHFYLQSTTFAFFGHVHVPLMFAHRDCEGPNPTIWVEKLKKRNFQNNTDHKFLINPGSVGQPRNSDNRSTSLIFDLETQEIDLVSIQYDIELTCKKIRESKLPNDLALRLIAGQ